MATHSRGNNVTKTISMSPQLKAESEARAERLGLSYSQYLMRLVRDDLEERGELIIREADDPPDVSSDINRARKRRRKPPTDE